MDTLAVVPGVISTIVRTVGPTLLGKLFLGTLGRSAIKIALWSWFPVIPVMVGEELIDQALNTIAPPPAIVITTTAKAAAGAAAANIATQGIYMVLGGVKGTLVWIKDASGLGALLDFAQNIFAHPEQTAKFLPSTSPGLAIIDDYDVSEDRKAIKAPVLPPYMSHSAIHQSTFSDPQAAFSASSLGTSYLGRSSRVRPGPGPAVIEIDDEQKRAIEKEYGANKIEVEDVNQLKKLLKDNGDWQDVLDILNDENGETFNTPWMSASVILNDKTGDQVTNFQASHIGDLSVSQHQPSAPPMWN